MSHPHASSQTTAVHRDISGWTVWADFGWWRASHFSVMRSGLGWYCQADWGVQLMDVLDGVLWGVYADTHCLRVPFWWEVRDFSPVDLCQHNWDAPHLGCIHHFHNHLKVWSIHHCLLWSIVLRHSALEVLHLARLFSKWHVVPSVEDRLCQCIHLWSISWHHLPSDGNPRVDHWQVSQMIQHLLSHNHYRQPWLQCVHSHIVTRKVIQLLVDGGDLAPRHTYHVSIL